MEAALFDITYLFLRFVFALDKNIPEFTVDEPAYQKVLKDDLALVVIKDGSINSYVTIPRELEKNKCYKSERNRYVNITVITIIINLFLCFPGFLRVPVHTRKIVLSF